MNPVALQSNDYAAEGVLYMAMELGDKHWKLVFSDRGAKRRHETVEAGRCMQLVEAIGKAKANFHLPEARVVSCYEAGLHRGESASAAAHDPGQLNICTGVPVPLSEISATPFRSATPCP
jgi:hypothetical protein